MSSDQNENRTSLFHPSSFINDRGVHITKSVIYEMRYIMDEHVKFTTQREDVVIKDKLLYSLPKLYLSLVPSDPTEYEFAMSVFGSWEVWDKMRTNASVKKEYTKWKNEAEVKIKSEALKVIIAEAKTSGKNAYSAAKFLQAKGWEVAPVSDTKPGSKASKQLKDKQQDEEAMALLQDDADRLGISIN